MPEYVWNFVCGEVEDGDYVFPEGVLRIRNGYVVAWEESH